MSAWLSVERIAMLANWPSATARRELEGLVALGLVEAHPDGERFRLTGSGTDAAIGVIQTRPEASAAWLDEVQPRSVDTGIADRADAERARATVDRQAGRS